MNTPTIKLYHDTRRKKANGAYPVKLYVYFNKKDKFYPLGIDLTEEEYLKATSGKPGKALKDTATRLLTILSDAQKKADKLYPFSLPLFEKEMFQKENSKSRSGTA